MSPSKTKRDKTKDSHYELVPLHRRPDLLQQCCKLLNSEWKRSETARLRSLNVSCDNFPTSLLLLDKKNELIGHCKVSLLDNVTNSVIIESFIIHLAYRFQGLGSLLLQAVEDYVYKIGIRHVYLMTKGQEKFYLKNGYVICEKIKQFLNFTKNNTSQQITENNLNLEQKIMTSGPPPPPMPNNLRPPPAHISFTLSTHTSMKKTLEF
ncbi:N-alpha-acetyltransferase 80 [Phymastichus coffea]|uniref:N-alpha-acetyltransferase 80 n=1 Tax=Phymastichus coffea TaxID=108790 RepID=UPI00273B3EC8|nr:N-alpha-acetyltransferase 80 [Phymastichus coffea]